MEKFVNQCCRFEHKAGINKVTHIIRRLELLLVCFGSCYIKTYDKLAEKSKVKN